MIYRLSGVIDHILPASIILDVNGVGYQLEMPLSDICQLPVLGTDYKVWVYTHVREDALRLFGFRSLAQRNVFETLISINGVGPKVALAMLSTLDPGAIRNAAFDGRTEVLESVPGIGKRTAERILIELKPKLQKLTLGDVGQQGGTVSGFGFDSDPAGQQGQVVEDLRSALENLGYKKKLIDPLLSELSEKHANANFQDLMRRALIGLRPPAKPESRI